MTKRFWLNLSLGTATWLGLCAASTGLYALASIWDVLALMALGMDAVATVLLGYLVGNWWALAAPLLVFVGLDVALALSGDPSAGATAVIIWPVFGVIALLVWVGIRWRATAINERTQPTVRDSPGSPG